MCGGVLVIIEISHIKWIFPPQLLGGHKRHPPTNFFREYVYLALFHSAIKSRMHVSDSYF